MEAERSKEKRVRIEMRKVMCETKGSVRDANSKTIHSKRAPCKKIRKESKRGE